MAVLGAERKARCSPEVTHPEDTALRRLRGGRGVRSLPGQGAGRSGRKARQAQVPRSQGKELFRMERMQVMWTVMSKVKNARIKGEPWTWQPIHGAAGGKVMGSGAWWQQGQGEEAGGISAGLAVQGVKELWLQEGVGSGKMAENGACHRMAGRSPQTGCG